MSQLAAWQRVYAHDVDGVPSDEFTEDDRALLAAAVEGGQPVRVRYSGPESIAFTHPVWSHPVAWVTPDGHVWAQTHAFIGVLVDNTFDEAPAEGWAVHSTTGKRHTKAFHRDTHTWRPSDEGEDVDLEWFVPAPLPGGDDDPCNGVVGRFCKAGYVNITKPNADDPTPGRRNQWNSQGGRNTVERTAVGEYTVTFPGIGDTRTHGHPQATGVASATCHVRSWGGQPDAVVRVVCRDRNGDPVNSKFTLLYLN